jgi:guanylate kinase
MIAITRRRQTMSKGNIVIVSGPSGVGKGTVLKYVFEKDPNIVYSVSSTTRKPRVGEVDGVHYNFISVEQFEKNIKDGKMLEYAKYCDNYYGTSLDYVESMTEQGKDVILEIEVQGALQIMEKRPDAISIFILPPSLEELHARLTGRGTETKEVIDNRINQAHFELSYADKYQFNVVNGKVETAGDEIIDILNKFRK